MSQNFFQNIYSTLSKAPDQELIVWPDPKAGAPATYTAAALHTRIQTIRQGLVQLGFKPKQKILVAIPVSVELICALLAVMAMGAIPVLPPAGASPAMLQQLMKSAHINVVLSSQQVGLSSRLLAKLCGIHMVNTTRLTCTAGAAEAPPIAVPANQPALISHSSGSTGEPKPILRSHQVLQAQHNVLKSIFPPTPGHRDFPLFPNVLLHNLSLGVTTVLPDVPWSNLLQLDPARLIQQLQTQQVCTLTGNVFYFEKLLHYLQENEIDLPHLRAIGIGGSPVPEQLAHRLRSTCKNAELYIIYGSSEAEPIAVRRVTAQQKSPHKGYAGGAIPASLEHKLDVTGDVIFADGSRYSVGEILVRGPHVATPDAGSWLRTGDFGYLNEDGELYLTGRKGNEAIQQGVQHYQLEHVLQHLPGIARTAAISAQNGFDILVEGTATEADVRELLHAHFPGELIKSITHKEALPVDNRHYSKILYSKLKSDKAVALTPSKTKHAI